MSSWESVRLGGEKVDLMFQSSSSGGFKIGSKYGSKNEDGYLALVKQNDVCWYQRPSDPRSVGVSNTGDVVVADWIEPGGLTDATVSVIDRDQFTVFEEHLDVPSPTVDISPDGDLVVLCPRGELARILDIQNDREIVRHEYGTVDPPIPCWITVDGDLRVEFRQRTDEEPLYRIDLSGNVTWSSDLFDSKQYYEVITLDESISWSDVIVDFASDYADTDDAHLKSIIANTIGDARLVDASRSILQEVIRTLTQVRSTFEDSEAHQKLVSQVLGEAYYRLASDLRSGVSVDSEFWRLVEQSAVEYRIVLPWYEGKRGLSKALRLQANQYTEQNRSGEARSCYGQIDLLESWFNISLLSTGDKRRLKEYRQKEISIKEPKETGRLIHQSQLSAYE